MNTYHYISSEVLSLRKITVILLENRKLALSEEAKANIERCRMYLDKKMETQQEPIYGINTGFGSLYNIKISNENLSQLQENLVKSHACGTGDEVPKDIVKLMLDRKSTRLNSSHVRISYAVFCLNKRSE